MTRASSLSKRLTVGARLENEDLDEELVEDIPNDVTLGEIVPKLSFRNFPKLCAISSGWKKAIQGYLVHDGRVRTQSTETFAVFKYKSVVDNKMRISLYSTRDQSWLELPPIGDVHIRTCQCVSLDGKIYLIGIDWDETSAVYMLDLAGQRPWRKCANMREPRSSFGATVLNGKIYAFGGCFKFKITAGAEEYDPQVDSWSTTIKPMPCFRISPLVEPVGEEIFIHGGTCYNSERQRLDPTSPESVEVYNPARDEWRSIQPFGTSDNQDEQFMGNKFVVQGKFHAIICPEDRIPKGISIYDMDTNSWSLSQSCSFPESPFGSGSPNKAICPLGETLVVDNDILQVVRWFCENTSSALCLLHGKEFGHKTQGINWEVIKLSSLHSKFGDYQLMCSIQL